MLKRIVKTLLKQRLKQYPAAALLGPRQCGKTTLAKEFSRFYFDLEQDSDQLRLDLEWPELCCKNFPVILDEAQAHPIVFKKLRGAIDADRKKNGRFIILGSVAPALMKSVSESLAGRLAVCELAPFLVTEIPKRKIDDLWVFGGFPDGGVLHRKSFPDWQQNYLRLLTQRDLPLWGLPSKPQLTMRLLKMLAASNAQIWNGSAIGSSLGISYHTANSYLEHLQNAFMVTVLPPFFKNIGKRLIKSPKIYWNDTGLLHSLLGVSSYKALLETPVAGASWEGFCIMQILGHMRALGRDFSAFYFRTGDGYEVDLLVEVNGKRVAIEFKLTTAPSEFDFKRLEQAAHLAGAHAVWLVSRTRIVAGSNEKLSTNLEDAIARLEDF